MSPLPWPLFGRRRNPYEGVTPPPVRLREEPTVRVVTGPPPVPPGFWPRPHVDERAEMRRAHAWVRAEDRVVARLAVLTDRYGPWTAAVRLFTNPKETRS